jgi:hypothetical protein
MRSIEPIPGEQWPHDMVIRIDVHTHLMTLLFIREAWGIARDANIPPLEPTPQVGDSAIPPGATNAEWSDRWREQWRKAWDWIGIDDTRRVAHRLDLGTSAITAEELSLWLPPAWITEYGSEGIDTQALARWESSLIDDHPMPFEQHPERRCLDALIPAWRAGVDSIIVLPYRGYYAERMTERHLAVSKATRDDPVLYDLALSVVS